MLDKVAGGQGGHFPKRFFGKKQILRPCRSPLQLVIPISCEMAFSAIGVSASLSGIRLPGWKLGPFPRSVGIPWDFPASPPPTVGELFFSLSSLNTQ